MKTNRILLIAFIFSLASVNFAQAQKSYKWMKKKCPAVTITDAGELYSTYEISEAELKEIRANGKLQQNHIDEILAKKKTGAVQWQIWMTV